MVWQPIETAPIDQPVLVWLEGFLMFPNVMYRDEEGNWHEAASDGRQLKNGALVTHWMPLPDAP